MRHLGWIFIALYAVLITGLFAFDILIFDATPIVTSVTCISLAVFLFGAGSRNMCRPIRRPRLWLPVAAAAFMLTLLAAGVTLALSELFRVVLVQSNETSGSTNALWLIVALLGNWLLWGVLLFVYTRDLQRFEVIYRLAKIVFAGSLAELLASVPAHIFVLRRGGCFAGISTSLGIMAGMCVMLWSFGPAILLLEAQQRGQFRRQRLSAGRHPSPRPRVQFGLHAMLAVTAGCGVLFGLTRILWGQWPLVALLGVLVVALITLLIVRRRWMLLVAALLVVGGLGYVFWQQKLWLNLAYLVVVSAVLFGLLRLDRPPKNG